MEVDEESRRNRLLEAEELFIKSQKEWFCSHLLLPAAVLLKTSGDTISVSLFTSTISCV